MSKYMGWLSDERLEILRGWARRGLTNEQIAENIGIAPCTLYDWQKKQPKIAEALKTGKDYADVQVENALYKRAVGYSYDEVSVEESPKGTTTRTTTKMVIPDTVAGIFWLKNRRPQDWRDKPVPDGGRGKSGVILMPDVLEETADGG